jgi:hypothetical protein
VIHPTTVVARFLLPQVDLVRTEFVLTNMALCGFLGLQPPSREAPENLDFWPFVRRGNCDNRSRLATRCENEGMPVTSNGRISVSLHI